jgi:response regulator of citrate/malate metabolism
MDMTELYCQPGGFKIPPEEIHVLVVEDDMNTALIEIALFHMMGVQYVYSSASIAQGLKFVDDVFRVDLILLNIGLLHEQSLHDWQQLLTHSRLKRARTIAVVDNTLLSHPCFNQSGAFDGWIETPVDFDRFYGQIRAVFNQ